MGAIPRGPRARDIYVSEFLAWIFVADRGRYAALVGERPQETAGRLWVAWYCLMTSALTAGPRSS
jgi:hypothetical protein